MTRPNVATRNGNHESRRRTRHDSDESSSDDDDNDEGEGNINGEPLCIADQNMESKAYSDFLRFLQCGCGGSPLNGYPTIVIVLSTIPPSVNDSSCFFLFGILTFFL